MIAKCQTRHLDFMALHPVFIAAYRVDLAVMGEAAEWLGQPPLGECVGRIALVENRHPAFEALVGEVRIKDGQGFSEKQALIDYAPRRQTADIEIPDLRRDDFLLDP